MQEGMRIKSKDIHFGISIFYLAINLFIDIFMTASKIDLSEKINFYWFSLFNYLS